MGRAMYVADNARKHGVREEGILHVDHPVRAFDLDDGFSMVVGAELQVGCWRSESSRATAAWWSYPP